MQNTGFWLQVLGLCHYSEKFTEKSLNFELNCKRISQVLTNSITAVRDWQSECLTSLGMIVSDVKQQSSVLL